MNLFFGCGTIMTKDKFYDQKTVLTDKFINDDVQIRIINIATSLSVKNGTIWILSNKNDVIVPIVNDIFNKNKIFKSFTVLDSKTKPNSSEEYEYNNDYKYLDFFNKDYTYSKNKKNNNNSNFW